MKINEIKGRPKFGASQFSGYVVWKQLDGFHVRWTTEGSKALNFQGKIISHDKIKVTKTYSSESREGTKETGTNTIEWNVQTKGRIDGFDFLTPGNITIELRINKKKNKPKFIFLGPNMINPEKNPIEIVQITAKKIVKIKKEKVKKEPKQ